MKNRPTLSALTISVTLVGSVAALGQEYKTREQVRAKLAEANRDGTILSGDGTLWRDFGGDSVLFSCRGAFERQIQAR
jgi:hypothetical protein